jgi:hypothetical protein
MKAVRWFLLCLLAFGLGTGVALAVNPPAVGIPSTTASQLSGDLAAVKQYAAEGRCTAVRARLDGAQSRISKLPANTNTSVVTELQDALGRVSSAAINACQGVSDAQLADEQRRQAAKDKAAEAAQTTPDATTPQSTPDVGGNDGGGPDPGTGEGATTPIAPSTPTDQPDTGSNGGAGLGDVEQKIQEAKKRWADRIQQAQDQWNRALTP